MNAAAPRPAWIASLAERFPRRAVRWRLRTVELALGPRPLVMGIVNVTPDSFSDGGHFFDAQRAIDHGLRLVAEGADLLDVGGESTRPYADPVAEREELRRVTPVVAALAERAGVPISIDTMKAAVAREALAAGAELINDISALTADSQMRFLAVEQACGVCAMHMRGTPQTMQDDPRYNDLVGEVLQYLRTRTEALVAAGIERERIAIDPGLGFGKTHQHNLDLAAAAWRFHELGQPLLVGPSRKGFIGKVLGSNELDRTAGTVGVCLSLALQGAQILRVHDVAAVHQALELFVAAGGIEGVALRLADRSPGETRS